MSKKKKIIIITAVAIVAAAVVGFGLFYKAQTNLVYSEVYAEAGSSAPDISEFLKRDECDVSFSEDSSFDMKVPGDYELKILWQMPVLGEKAFPVTLHVTDTTAPVAEGLSEFLFYSYEGNTDLPDAMSLISSVSDVTECSAEFAKDYDFTSNGEFDAEIVVSDTSGNTTTVTVPCTVICDTTAPEISGVEELYFTQGETFSYTKNITVTDDYDENPTLDVDTSGVNPDKRGVYTITYTATDAAGNTSTKTTSVHVLSAKIAAATEETVYGMADAILAEIITDDMDQKAQAKAVFDWVVYNITYSESAGIDDLLSAAYKGMYNRVGDCTVKQKTAEVLLNRLGIKNMEIEKIRDHRGHYWLLIDIGEGWYHYDPNLQLDGTLIFYWHDADLWAYSNAHSNTHNYDKSKYPTIQ